MIKTVIKQVLKINLILFILIICISGCLNSGVKQSNTPIKTTYEKIEINNADEKKIDNELNKLQTIVEEEYKISTGDQLDIYVYDNQDLNTKGVTVMPDGTISMELIGVVEVGEKTIPESQGIIEKRLRKYIIKPIVTIVPNNIKSSTFTIVGAVINSGVYEIKSGYRITDAIGVAQGFKTGWRGGETIDIANLDHAFIVRNDKMLPVNFEDIFNNGNFMNNIPLMNEDYIYIPSSVNLNVYLMGEIVIPGNCPYKNNLTLVQALSYANGKKETSSGIAIVLRGNLIKPDVYKINFEDMLRGMAPDFKLKPNDIIYFPSGEIDDYNLTVNQVIPTFVLLNLLTKPIAAAAGGAM